MTSRGLRRACGGFTLLEVLLSITLSALVLLILYGAFEVGQRAVRGVERSFAGAHETRALGNLSGYIRSAYPYRSAEAGQGIFFFGGEDELTFVSALSLGLGGRGFAKIHVSATEAGDGRELVVEEEMPVQLKEDEGAAGQRERLVLRRGVRRLRLEYLEPGGERWVESWNGKERGVLPRAVRVNIYENAGESQWVVPVMMSVLAP